MHDPALPVSGHGEDPLEVRNRQIAAVHTITRRLFATPSLDERLRDILTVSTEAVGAAAGSIYLHRAADDTLVFQAVVGPQESAGLTGRVIDARTGIAGKVFQEARPAIDHHPRDSAGHRRDIGEQIGFETLSMVSVPIMHRGARPIGVMQILNKREGAFGQGDLEVLEIVATIAATAIENSQLQRDAQVAAVAHAVGDLSHDIKNKVAPIAIAVHLLRPDMDALFDDLDALAAGLDPASRARLAACTAIVRGEYAEHCDIVLSQVEAVQEHTKRIADALKGTVAEPNLELQDIGAALRDELRQLGIEAKTRRIDLVCDVDAPRQCRFDRFLLRSAVYNLVRNAMPETAPGGAIGVRVTWRRDGEFPQGSYVVVEVSDTGRGIPRAALERILRGDAASTRHGGTGLGTRIVYNAALAHRGLFEGESAEGVGTTFRVRLPLVTE